MLPVHARRAAGPHLLPAHAAASSAYRQVQAPYRCLTPPPHPAPPRPAPPDAGQVQDEQGGEVAGKEGQGQGLQPGAAADDGGRQSGGAGEERQALELMGRRGWGMRSRPFSLSSCGGFEAGRTSCGPIHWPRHILVAAEAGV